MKRKSNYLDLLSNVFADETNELIINGSTSRQRKWSFSQDKDIDVTSVSEKPLSSSDGYNNIALSVIERLVVKRNAEKEEQNLDDLVKALVDELEQALRLFDYEEGLSSAEKVIIKIEKKYRMRILGEVLQEIYVRYFDKPSYLVGICISLLRYDLVEVQPWGAAMLPGLLNHPSERVKEATVQLIDNWADVELLPILRNLQVSSLWMNDYLQDVVESLERINVLHQEVI